MGGASTTPQKIVIPTLTPTKMSSSFYFSIVQYVGFISSEFLNALLIWLILTKANKNIGSYKNLMLAFAIFSMFYGFVEIATQPVIYSKDTIFVMIVDTVFKRWYNFSIMLVCVYIGSFGLCITLLATHFLYRYLAVCRTSTLSYFEGYRFFILFLPGAIVSFCWTSLGYVFLYPSELKSSLLAENITENYGIDIYKAPYISLLYYLFDEHGNIQIFSESLVFCYALTIILLCQITMIFCGRKCFKALNGVTNMSRRTKDLNKQLFLTLVVQTLVPVVTMFTPVSALFVLPVFSIDMGPWASVPVMYASLYPALDALVVICMIRDFRTTLTCKKQRITGDVTARTTSSREL